jgi:hypothetical protein
MTQALHSLETEPIESRDASWLVSKRMSLVWVVPVLAITAMVRLINLGGSPQRVDDEGTYVAQAYAVSRLGDLSHYTYWYDHPPLGWIQIAGWEKLTLGFRRYDVAVLAGREFIVVAGVVAAAMLFILARRLRLSRPAAGAAVPKDGFPRQRCYPVVAGRIRPGAGSVEAACRLRRGCNLLLDRGPQQGNQPAIPTVSRLADVEDG